MSLRSAASDHARVWRRRLAAPWRRARKILRQRTTLRDWEECRRRARAVPQDAIRPMRRLVILPPYPEHVFGSKGDEATISAAVDTLREFVPGLEVGVFTSAGCRDAGALLERGWRTLPVARWRIDEITRSMDAFGADGCLVIGADMMDGFYDPSKTTISLAVADMAARAGLTSVVSGFSFNANPTPSLREAFGRLDPGVVLNLRDPLSLSRFQAFTTAPARLVADVAFLLRPSETSPRVRLVREWVRSRSRAGDVVLGVNVHPALAGESGAGQPTRMIDTVARSLGGLLERRALSVVLLSHDDREDIAVDDGACLAAIESRLPGDSRDRIHRPTSRMTAAEVKAIVGTLDAVFAGRMHAVIAALGMGVPVAAICYQQKFEGLFGMFGIRKELLAGADVLSDSDRLAAMLDVLLDDLAVSRAGIHRTLEGVRDAAMANIAPFLRAASLPPRRGDRRSLEAAERRRP